MHARCHCENIYAFVPQNILDGQQPLRLCYFALCRSLSRRAPGRQPDRDHRRAGDRPRQPVRP
jgi:hypothetical protein